MKVYFAVLLSGLMCNIFAAEHLPDKEDLYLTFLREEVGENTTTLYGKGKLKSSTLAGEVEYQVTYDKKQDYYVGKAKCEPGVVLGGTYAEWCYKEILRAKEKKDQ